VTSVVLADDQDLVRTGLRALLEARGVEVLAEAQDGRAALEATRSYRPDVLVMDIRMPVLDGIAATRAVVAAGLSARVLILTTYDLDEYVYQALRAGAAGFMLKATPPDRLVDAIDVVAAGEALLAPSLTLFPRSCGSSPSGSARCSCSSPAASPTTKSPPSSSLASRP
jgi:DNA-binding NarL/FixJ family response regulator